MKLRNLLWGSLSLLSFYLNAMDQGPAQAALIPLKESTTAITKWPEYLYSEAFPGAMGNPFEPQENIDFLLKKALRMTREEADRIDLVEPERVQLDWAYALHQVEKELLRKPFETFTMEDISLISSWLARTTAEHPGAFRTKAVQWRLKSEFSQSEKERLDVLKAREQRDISAEDEAFISSCFLRFPEADMIKPDLENYLKTVKLLIARKNQLRTGVESIYVHLAIALFANTSMVSIHPFEEGSKRLGRLLMYIYLAQQGIKPITFFSSSLYIDKLIETLTLKNKNAFRDYVHESLVASTQLRRNPHYITILYDVLGNGCPANLIHSLLLNHPLHKEFLANQVDKQLTTAGSPAKKKVPGTHNVCAACSKRAGVDRVTLKSCSACKAISYCSTACQKAHWPSHKLACQKNSKK